jgi:Zn-dependent M16 (insulinase) family peptidase
MELKTSEIYHGFQVQDQWEITEIESTAYLLEHLQSGARLLYLKNDDDNKVFSVTFRTPPVDSCGTPHIMEHSVLCGSQKYPLKEPFVELVKSSMNTFLNAITFPDKTMYPVASKNHADFLNLVDVYCDAVFNPLVRENIYTFYQEGWHYHLEQPEDPIAINGVVYNEMKGAFSDPEEILMRYVQASLYPDTPYAFESGGDPDVIPTLTYEKFVDYYNLFYHPSNAYFYFYGDMDLSVYLKKLDEEYLSQYEKITVDSLPAAQQPFQQPTEHQLMYSIGEEDQQDGRCYFAANFKIGAADDTLLSYAFNVLSNILFDSDASPLKKALIDAEIADEITYDYTTAVREPYFSVIAKNAKKEKYQTFLDVIETTLQEIIDTGIDAAIIKSALNSYEFDLREADSGNYPKGLIYNLDVMESWLYDAKPGIHLQYEPCLHYLREHETSEYYCGLIKRYFIDNPHRSTIRLIPQKNLERDKTRALSQKLQEYKESLSEEGIASLVKITNELIRRQSDTDSEEAKSTIPVIALDEVDRNLPAPDFAAQAHQTSTLYVHTDKTRGIVYTDINFPMNGLSVEDLPACGLLTNLLGVYATERYTELELANQIGTYLGDIDVMINTHQNVTDPQKFEARFVFFAKALNDYVPKLFELSEEILLHTKIDNLQRVYKTVCEEISKFKNKLIGAAHQFVSNRLHAMLLPRGAYNEACTGITYYRYLLRVKKEIETQNDTVLNDLNRICSVLVNSYRTDC